MKHHQFCIAGMALILNLLSTAHARPAAKTDEVKSSIRAVTLFPDRAYVKRMVPFKLQHGAQSLLVTGVTPLADPESIRVLVSQQRGITILGIRPQMEFLLNGKNAELNQWIEKQKVLQEKIARIFTEAALLGKDAENMNLLSAHYRESFSLNLHQGKYQKNDLTNLIQYFNSQSSRRSAAWRDLLETYDRISKELQFASFKVNELNSVSDRRHLNIAVDLLADSAIQGSLDLEYLVRNAGWSSVYDLRVDSTKNSSQINQGAHVWQKSGEDWNRVELSLSNMRSELRVEAPAIFPYTVSFHEVNKVQTNVGSAMNNAETLTVGALPPGESPANKAPEENGLAHIFKVPQPQSIRSGQAQTKVFIAQKTLPYSEHLELVPAQYLRVYRKGEVTNKFSWDLAPGPMAVFYNGAYLQQSWLDEVPQGKNFGVNAGVDAHFVVTRDLHDIQSPGGIIERKKTMTREFLTRIENYSPHAQKVKVLEQLPISEIKEVEVDSNDSTAGFKQEASVPGWIYWEREIAPRAHTDIKLKINLHLPKDFNFSWGSLGIGTLNSMPDLSAEK